MPTKSTSKKKTATRKPAARKLTAKQREAKERARNQMWAVVLFALGILLGCMAFIKGSSFWNLLHSSLFGLFGFGAYLLAPMLIYIAITASLDKPTGPAVHKLWQGLALLLLICALLQITGMGLPKSIGFGYSVTEIFEAGIALKGGGLAGAILGLPLLHLFERTGALITICLLIFVFVMIITGSTLIGLFRSAAKPVRKLEQVYSDRVEERRSNPPAQEGKSQRRFNIDIPLDEKPAPQSSDPIEPPWEGEAKVKKAQPPSAPPEPSIPVTPEESAPTEACKPEAENAYLDEIIRKMVSSKPTPPPEEEPHGDAEEPAADLGESTPPPAETPEDSQVPLTCEDDHENPQTEEIQEEAQEELPDEDQEHLLKPAPTQERIYVYPSITLLNEPKPSVDEEGTPEELKANAQRLVDTLQSFGVQTRIIDICRGPAVTRYELQPSAGVKISKITGLSDDIALNLAASGVRIEAPIPNKAAVGIEIPNKTVNAVTLREVLDSAVFVGAKSRLSVAMGRDIAGNIMVADIGKMPHVLIAGATGSGKSVCINSIIMSLLYKASDKEVKFLMIDPKVVELGIYNGIPHLLVPVVTDPKKAAGALNWAVGEMLKRYQTFAENSVRDLSSYNELASASETLPEMPQIVIIIDELSDLMMAAPSEVEDAICRLAQMARAAGMHLVIATQRPSVDVITGIIKANIPSRVAFAVSSQVDSRTILDGGGAEKLLGRGDMLFAPVGAPKPIRVQGCFVTDKEVERVVSFIKEGEIHQYDQQIIEEIDRQAPAEKGQRSDDGGGFEERDDILPTAIEAVIETGQASTSFLQRRLKVGYARAGRLIDEMEQMGIVGPFEGSKPRQVLISKERWYEMKMNSTQE